MLSMAWISHTNNIRDEKSMDKIGDKEARGEMVKYRLTEYFEILHDEFWT